MASPLPVSDTAPIMGLPSHLRLRIFTAAGILSDPQSARFIDLHRDRVAYRRNLCRDFDLTYALLLTCRTFYEDVATAVYSNNHFFIRYLAPEVDLAALEARELNRRLEVRYTGTRKLQALRQLTPTAIRSLRKLTVHLNVASCGLGQPCDRAIDPWCETPQDQIPKTPLRIPEAAARDVTAEWQQIWRDYIQPHLARPSQLELNFICDVADVDTGVLAAEPFLATQTTRIARCSIRLSAQKDRALQLLAEQAVASIAQEETARPSSRSQRLAFRFMDLPTELRQHVLRYTDVVTPHKEVEYNPEHGMYCRTRIKTNDNNFSEKMHAKPQVPDGSDETRPEKVYRDRCWKRSSKRGCFCSAYHSAASSFFVCKCWTPPTSLFLVCRTMREDAMQVFFSQNRFVVVPSGGGEEIFSVEESPHRLPVSIFLREIVPRSAIRHLRFLEIVFPSFGKAQPCKFCPPGSPEQRDWIQTLEAIKSHITLSQLTIRVYFAMHRATGGWTDYRQSMSQAERLAVKESYISTLAPLKALRGMKCFIVHLINPAFDWLNEEEKYMPKWEAEIERMVMGKSYSSALAREHEAEESRWAGDWGSAEDWQCYSD